MLEDSGSIEPGAFAKMLKAIVNKPEADFDRPHFQYIRRMAIALDGRLGELSDGPAHDSPDRPPSAEG